jgi:hypothetical protein
MAGPTFPTFPTLSANLMHGIKVSYTLPVAVVGNGAIESRIRRTRFARTVVTLPGRLALEQDRATLIQFWGAQGGAENAFLFQHPINSGFVGTVGIGDGVKTTFQLIGTVEGLEKPIFNPNNNSINATTDAWATTIQEGAGVAFSMINGFPHVVFSTPPAPGTQVVVSGLYKMVMRFADSFDFEISAPGYTAKLPDIKLIEVFEDI